MLGRSYVGIHAPGAVPRIFLEPFAAAGIEARVL